MFFLSLVIVPLVNISIAALVLLKGVKNIANQVFVLILFGVTIWTANIFVLFHLGISHHIWWARAIFVEGGFIAWMFLYFAILFPKRIKLPKPLVWFDQLWIHIVGVLLMIASLSPFVISGVNTSIYPVQALHGSLYSLYILTLLIFLLAGVSILYFKLRKLSGVEHLQVQYVFIGFCVSIGITIFTNIIYPLVTKLSTFSQIGPISLLFLFLTTTYAILRHRLFNITLQLQKTINTLIPLLLSFILTVLSAFIIYRHTSLQPMYNGIILLACYTLLYKSFNLLFTKTRLSYLFFRKTYHFHKTLIEFSDHASDITNFDDLLKQMQRAFLGDGFIEAFAFFIITDQEKKACHVLETHNFDPKDIAICAESVLHPILYQELSNNREPLVIAELPYSTDPKHHALREAFNPLEGGVCIPLFISNDLAGIILLGTKAHGGAYTIEDIEVFQKISIPLAMAVTKAALFTHLSERVTRLDQENNNLETSNHELQEMKSEFLTIVNHQLNTPLSVMRSVMSMIEDGDVPLEDVQNYVKQISPKMNAFSQIVKDMLDAAEFEGAGATLEFKTTDVNEVLNKAFAECEELKKQNNVTVQLQLQNNLPRVLTDSNKFLRALEQLIKNAIIYGKEKPVTITTQQNNDHIIISVQDNGRGFDKSEAEKIGGKFYRGKNVADYLADGSGLGVYTAKKIIEASGGALMWNSAGAGQGSTFTINLPKATDFAKAVVIK